MQIEPIAYFHSPFATKFGVPKQSGLVENLEGTIEFVPQYRNADALRGIEAFDYLWLVWEFSANSHAAVSPVVRPPLLGGNTRMGVFATRSPFRPNPIGLSSVRIDRIDYDCPDGPVIHVLGADLMDGTPIYDIKPYIPYTDAHPEARGGFTDTARWQPLEVMVPEELEALVTQPLRNVLAQDPRPQYHDDPGRIYGMSFDGRDVRFKVEDRRLTVVEIVPAVPSTPNRKTKDTNN